MTVGTFRSIAGPAPGKAARLSHRLRVLRWGALEAILFLDFDVFLYRRPAQRLVIMGSHTYLSIGGCIVWGT
jgi:hypothetical protein